MNDLTAEDNPNVEVILPNIKAPENFNNVLPENTTNDSIKDITTFGKTIIILSKQNNQNNLVHLINLKSKDDKNQLKTYDLKNNDFNCQKVKIDEQSIQLLCISFLQQSLFFVLLEIDKEKEILEPKVEEIDYLKSNKPLEDSKLEMDQFNGLGPNKLIIFYYRFAQDFTLMNKICLHDKKKHSVLEIEGVNQILGVSVAVYNQFKEEGFLFILVKKEETNQLRQYKIKDKQFSPLEDNSPFKIIKDGIIDFIYKDNSLLYIEKDNQGKIWVNLYKIENLSTLKMELREATQYYKSVGGKNFFGFLYENKEKQKGVQIIDVENCKFMMLKSSLKLQENLIWAFVNIEFKSHLVFVNNRDIQIVQLESFKNICLQIKENSKKQEIVNFKLKNEIIFQLEINRSDFSELNSKQFQKQKFFEYQSNEKESNHFLAIQGNNMQFDQKSQVYYFHQVTELEQENKDDSLICPIKEVTIKSRQLVYLCQNGKLIIRTNFQLDQTTNQYLFDFTTLKMDFEFGKIKSFKTFFNSFFVILNNQNNFIYFTLEENGKTSDLFIDKSQTRCHLTLVITKTDLFCQVDNSQWIIVGIEKSNNKLIFKDKMFLSLPNIVIGSLIVSIYDSSLIYYIRKSFHKKNVFYLVKSEKGTEYKIEMKGIDLDQNSKIYEVSENEIVVLGQLNGKFVMKGMIGFSIIEFKLENMHMKQEENLIGVEIIEESKLIALLFYLGGNEYKLCVCHSTLNIFNRIVQEKKFSMGKINNWKNVQIKASLFKKSIVFFHIFEVGDNGLSISFIYYLQGPMYYIPKDQPQQVITFKINQEHFSKEIIGQAKYYDLNFDCAKEVEIKAQQGNQVKYDLEKNQIIEFKEGVFDVRQVSDSSQIKFIPRIQFTNKFLIRSDNQGMDIHLTKSLLIDSNNNFVVYYEDYLYHKERGETIGQYKQCLATKALSDDKQLSEVLLCRDKQTNEYFLTNLKTLFIGLGIYRRKLVEFQIIKKNDYLYFTGLFYGKKIIKLIIILRYSLGFKIELQQDLIVSEFGTDQGQINSYFVSPYIYEGYLIFLIHQGFSSQINIRAFNLHENIFNKQMSQEMEVDQIIGEIIYGFQCVLDNRERTNCFLRTDKFIYDLDLKVKQNKQFEIELKTKYLYIQGKITSNGLQIASSDQYLAVRQKSREDYKILIYKRDYQNNYDKQKMNQIFGSIKVEKNKSISRIAMRETSNGVNLYTLVFQNKIHQKKIFRELYVYQYQIGNMSLKAGKSAYGYENELELEVIGANLNIKQCSFKVVLNRNFFNYVLILILVSLCIIMVVVMGVTAGCYFDYKQKRYDFHRQQQNNTTFLDQTKMRV